MLLFFLPGVLAQAQGDPEKKDSLSPRSRPLYTDRPGISESPFLIGRGDLQVETGFNLELDNKVDVRRQSLTYLSSLLKFGVSDNCELRLLTEYIRNRAYDQSNDLQTELIGWMPVMIGSKILIVRGEGIKPQVSFIGYLKLPLATDVYQTHYTAPVLKLVFSHELSDKWSFGYNLGATWDGEQPKACGLYTFSVSRSLYGNVGAFVEIYGYFGPGYQPDHRADAGFTYLLTSHIQLDISGGVGCSASSPDGFLNMGMAWRIFKH